VPGHPGADARTLDAAGGAFAHDPAAVHDQHAVGDGEQLVELRRAEQHRDAAPRSGANVAVDRFDRTDVEAARRLRGDEQAQPGSVSSRARTAFCWLPPDSAENGTSELVARMSNASMRWRASAVSAVRSTRPRRLR
jgi:hypothetical protein